MASVSHASADEAPSQVTLDMGFGGAVMSLSASGAKYECAKPLKLSQPTLFSAQPSQESSVCVSAAASGLNVQFVLPSKNSVDFEYPSKLSCVTLNGYESRDLIAKIQVIVNDARIPVECDVNRSFLYTLSIERHGSVTPPYVRPKAGARAWQSMIEIPWSILPIHTRKAHVKLLVFGEGSDRAIAESGFDVAIRDLEGSASLVYAPFLGVATSAPSSKKPKPRLRVIGSDDSVDFDRHTLLAMTFAQNDAASAVSRSLSQIVGGAPIPLPVSNLNTGPDSLMIRTQPLVGFLKPSGLLGDQDLRVFVDSAPFSISRVGSLASGYTLGYSSDVVSAAGFYGLQQSGLSTQAYALTLSIPTPAPRPTPTPTPSPTPTASVVQEGVAPPSLPRPGTFEDSKTSHDPLAQLALLDSIAVNGTYIDSVSGLAFGTNLYKNTCSDERVYCALTFHTFASTQHDAHPRTTSPVTFTPADASNTQFAGESLSYTSSLSPLGATPRFIQIAEMLGVQRSDRFYSPASGSVQAFAPLSGTIGHATLSYGVGKREHIYSFDVLGVRLTSPYGDAFTNVAWQAVIPFDISNTPGWSVHAELQNETLSDRVAQLQQGLVSSYFSAVFPTVASVGAPVSAAIVRPQSQSEAELQSPALPLGGLTVQFSGGYQGGFVTNCAPAPTLIVCTTGHDHAGTWAIFLNHDPVGFGVATTSSTSIPGDLAVASTARYFGSYVNAPGSVTSYITFNKCVQFSAAYTNAANPTGVPLPQKGATTAIKVYYPFHDFGLEAGYFNITDTQSSTFNQSGYYTLLRFATSFKKPAPGPGCPK